MSSPLAPEYHFRGSVFDAPIALCFDGDKLVVRQGERPPRTLALADVVRVRLWWKRERGGYDQYLCSLDFARPGGPEQPFVTFGSRSHLSANHAESRPREYRDFVHVLHQRLLAAGTRAAFVTGPPNGSPWIGFARRAGWAFLVALILSRFARLPIHFALVAVVVYLGFVFPGALAGHARTGPGAYDPDVLPERCLPAKNAA